MPTIKFDDLLKEQLKDPKFKEGYYEEVNYGDPQLVEKCPVSKIKIS